MRSQTPYKYEASRCRRDHITLADMLAMRRKRAPSDTDRMVQTCILSQIYRALTDSDHLVQLFVVDRSIRYSKCARCGVRFSLLVKAKWDTSPLLYTRICNGTRTKMHAS